MHARIVIVDPIPGRYSFTQVAWLSHGALFVWMQQMSGFFHSVRLGCKERQKPLRDYRLLTVTIGFQLYGLHVHSMTLQRGLSTCDFDSALDKVE